MAHVDIETFSQLGSRLCITSTHRSAGSMQLHSLSIHINIITYSTVRIRFAAWFLLITSIREKEKKTDAFRYILLSRNRACLPPHCCVVLLVEMRIDGPSLLLEHQSRRVLAMPLQSSLSWELGWERAVLVCNCDRLKTQVPCPLRMKMCCCRPGALGLLGYVFPLPKTGCNAATALLSDITNHLKREKEKKNAITRRLYTQSLHQSSSCPFPYASVPASAVLSFSPSPLPLPRQ